MDWVFPHPLLPEVAMDRRFCQLAFVTLAMSLGCAVGADDGNTTFGNSLGSGPSASGGTSGGTGSEGTDSDPGDTGSAEGSTTGVSASDTNAETSTTDPSTVTTDPATTDMSTTDMSTTDMSTTDMSSSTTQGGGGQPAMGMWAHCEENMYDNCTGNATTCLYLMTDGYCSTAGCQNAAADCDPVPVDSNAVAICADADTTDYCAMDCSGGKTCPAGMICQSITFYMGGPTYQVCF